MSIASLIEATVGVLHEDEKIETVIFGPYKDPTPDPEWIREALEKKSTNAREIGSWALARPVLDIPLDSPAGGVITVKTNRRRDIYVRHNGARWVIG